jgi:hypothetical protein
MYPSINRPGKTAAVVGAVVLVAWFVCGVTNTARAGQSSVTINTSPVIVTGGGEVTIGGQTYGKGKTSTTLVEGSGTIKTETRAPGAFSRASVLVLADVICRKGDKPSVTVTGDDNILPLVTTKVQGGKLEIAVSKPVSLSRALKIELETSDLRGLDLASAGSVDMQEVKCPAFDLTVTGSGTVKGAGETDELTVGISGTGEVDLKNLKSKNARISINGTGDGSIFASGVVSVEIMGTGDLVIYGNPTKVNREIMGIGDVRVVDE